MFGDAPADGVAYNDGGSAGLKTACAFARVEAGQSGVGTAFIRGELTVVAPASTRADTSWDTLTFTCIGS